MVHKILVVEDDQPILDLMDILIRKLGYEPILIPNGLEAIKRVQKESPSLILLDIMMTPINGWEFLEKLRRELGMKEIPVVLFTASPLIGEKMEQLKDPHLSVLTKPVTFSELKDRLTGILEKPT
jgi:CheY-like chemotaxis protein